MKRTSLILFLVLSSLICQSQVSILFPEIYFGSELHDINADQSWIGLFEDEENQFYLEDVVLSFEKVQHPIIDGENEKTGIHIISNPENPVIIFSNPQLFKIGKVPVCNEYKAELFPGEATIVQFGGKKYIFSASGDMETLPSGEKVISNYKMFVAREGYADLLIGEAEFFDDMIFNIRWIGDLNGDNGLDLLIDLSYKYSFQEIVLFMSNEKQAKLIFKEVGRAKKYFD